MPKEGPEAGHGPEAGDGPWPASPIGPRKPPAPAAESLPPLGPRGPRADAGRDPAGMRNESRRPAETGRAMPEGGPAVDPESIRADLAAEFERRMREMASAYERKLALAMRGGREQRVFAVCSIVPEAPTTLAAVEAAIWASDRLPGMRATVVEHDPRKLPSLAPYGAIAPGDDAFYPDVARPRPRLRFGGGARDGALRRRRDAGARRGAVASRGAIASLGGERGGPRAARGRAPGAGHAGRRRRRPRASRRRSWE